MKKLFDMHVEGAIVKKSRGDCPNFEPPLGIVEPFVAAFFLPAPPYLVRAGQMLQESA
jgi:hypothetical protein